MIWNYELAYSQTGSAEDEADLEAKMHAGWEPFAVTKLGSGTGFVVHLRHGLILA